MSDSSHTVIHTILLGTVCALLLTGTAVFTEPYIKDNKEAEKNRNIFSVLEIPYDENETPKQLVERFENNVRTEERNGLKVYFYPKTGDLKAVAVMVEGPGLWAPIRGFLALESDMVTIRGVTFHEQEETPGLGGEIGTREFQMKFQKKLIVTDGKPGVKIGQDCSVLPNGVDGITGATMTCDKVQSLLNKAIEKFLKEYHNDR